MKTKIATLALGVIILLLPLLSGCMGIAYYFLERTSEFIDGGQDLPEEVDFAPIALTPAPLLLTPSAYPSMVQLEDYPFSLMRYVRPDTNAFDALLENILSDMDGMDFAQLSLGYEEAQRIYAHIDSQATLADLYYRLDYTQAAMRNESLDLFEKLGVYNAKMARIMDKLLEIDDAQAAGMFSPGYVQHAREAALLSSDDVVALWKKQDEAVLRYEQLRRTHRVNYGARELSWQEIQEDATLSYEQHEQLCREYYKQLGQKALEILNELITIRSAIAKQLGMDSYAQYCYRYYARDYTPKDVQALYADVKKHVPALLIAVEDLIVQEETQGLYDIDIDPAQALDWLSDAAASVSPALQRQVEAMRRSETINLMPNALKEDSAFSLYLDDYSTPFLFMNWDYSYHSVATLGHEIGHCYRFAMLGKASWNDTQCMDLEEIDSQGLEVLLNALPQPLLGDGAYKIWLESMAEALYVIASGCMQDEFLQTVYDKGEMGPEEIERLYAKLHEEYGLSAIYIQYDGDWASIPHNFTSPFYYISYATSMVSSFSFAQMAQEDWDGAIGAYNALVNRDQYTPYQQVLGEIGLLNPFEKGTVQKICQWIKDDLGLE